MLLMFDDLRFGYVAQLHEIELRVDPAEFNAPTYRHKASLSQLSDILVSWRKLRQCNEQFARSSSKAVLQNNVNLSRRKTPVLNSSKGGAME